jgi:hypothetical protein
MSRSNRPSVSGAITHIDFAHNQNNTKQHEQHQHNNQPCTSTLVQYSQAISIRIPEYKYAPEDSLSICIYHMNVIVFNLFLI